MPRTEEICSAAPSSLSFLRKRGDVHVHDARGHAGDVVPNALENLRAGQQFSVGFAQEPEQPEFERGQRDRATVVSHRVQVADQFDVAEAQSAFAFARARTLAAAQERADPRDQLVAGKWFGDEVVGAQSEAGQLDVLAGLPADQQDVGVGRLRDRFAEFEPRNVGQADVEQHDVGPIFLDLLEALTAGHGDARIVAGPHQHRLLERGHVGIVFDDQDARGTLGHAALYRDGQLLAFGRQ
jgi:hypothetical protein